ncbi:MAG: ZIP family metal transporter [Phyllobacterium sp.]|uniref:ZIP family metal transporter n=1 Tax=Phyllobacterium sp. TaxID=1871046 RepID=UPI0030F0AB98
MTGIGALPVLLGQTFSRRASDILLGFAAGVMLAASFFSLIMPGIDAAHEIFGGRLLPAAVATGGVSIGVAVMAMLNETIPHEHFFQSREGSQSAALARIWLFILAITIHKAPEGLAVGVGFGGGDIGGGTTLAIGIGLQNAPEGLAVALALLTCGYSKFRSFNVAMLTGMVEPVAGLLGAYAVSLSYLVLP